METTEELIEKDEDLKATESRIVDLRQKKDRTTEEEDEFKKLKQHHRGRVEEQISNERERAQEQSERAARAEQALLDAQQRLKALEEKRDTRNSDSNDEYIVINGQKFLTDEALAARVQAGKMTQKEAWKMQQAAIEERVYERIKGEEPKNEASKVRNESLEFVKKEGYGWMLDAKDPKHNANDPLFKEANRLWFNGYQFHPDGPRLALEDAKKNLSIGVKKPDLSEEFGVSKNNAASEASSQRSKQVVLSDIEHSNAIRFYCMGNVNNPKTGRTYTESEALQKALDAKRKRLVK